MRRLVFAAVFAIGCGDNVAGLTFDEFEVARQHAECERLARCGLFEDGAACDRYVRFRADVATAEAIDAGAIAYSSANAMQCLDQVARLGCDISARDVRVPSFECLAALRGSREVGQECSFDEECSSGACETPTCPRNMCCAGSCTATRTRSAIGGACMIDADCVDDSFCAKDQLCTALASAGQPCGDDADCGYGLGCIGATELDDGTCRVLPHLGESCPYLRCAEIGLRCDQTFTCVAVRLPGDPCPDGDECSPDAACEQQVCADLPTLGMPCSGRCGGASFCGASAVCEAPLENTEPCGADLECATHYCEEGPAFDFCTDPPVCF